MPSPLALYDRHDLADFAQEFLRRNPQYQGAYRSKGVLNPMVMARRWGLAWPVPP